MTWASPFRRRRPQRDEKGYFTVLTITMFVTLFGLAAFAVDVGNWYWTGQQEQRAADAGALAGVPNLPASQATAFSTAKQFSAENGYKNGVDTVTVITGIDGTPTRLRVTVTKTVDNFFGGLFGIPTTTITRTAVADFAGPVPLGSPCNEFGNDPDAASNRSAHCADTGQFWANVGSPGAPKRNGDAYQDNVCTSGDDGCTGSSNTDYDVNGYFYTVTVAQTIPNLVIQAFDPALIDVGDTCDSAGNINGASSLPAAKTVVTDPATRYAAGASSPYCTGDIRYGGTGQVATKYTMRLAGGNPWDPTSYPVSTISGCPGTTTFPGFSGPLKTALDKTNAGFNATVAANFRQWKTLCTVNGPVAPGTYIIQVQTNGNGADAASGHNRFGLRAYSSTSATGKDNIYLAGYNKMGIYANLPSATTLFYLARVPSGSGGQILNVRLFDVGDAGGTGSIQVLAPADSGVTFTNCKGTGPTAGNLATCSIPTNSSIYQGKWETISVPIPAGYSCNDNDQGACWVKLKYTYGAGNQPSDTTSWTASIEGDPVRLVE
jgi:hypothetical protein